MAPRSVQEFRDDTALERLVLDRLASVANRDGVFTIIDLRGQIVRRHAIVRPVTIGVSVTDSIGGGHSEIEHLQPLLFGSAWKVLDLLVEYAMSLAGHSADRRGRYNIREKVNVCRAGLQAPLPFGSHGQIWTVLTACYAATAELRHTLVHRRALIVDGSLIATDDSGRPSGVRISVGEQQAFCRAVQRAADATIGSGLDARNAGDLAYSLDALGAHHRAGPLGGVEAPQRVVVVQMTPEEIDGEILIDIEAIREAAARAVAGERYYDLEVHLGDGRLLTGRLEEAGMSPVRFDTVSLPHWLHWV